VAPASGAYRTRVGFWVNCLSWAQPASIADDPPANESLPIGCSAFCIAQQGGERFSPQSNNDKHQVSLNSINRPGFVNAHGVHFAMLHDNTSIRILITRNALQGEGSAIKEDAYLSRFNSFRDVYEIVAKQKFETENFKGSMAITLGDLMRFGGESRRPPSRREIAA
jgi:hypothetical protein